jgi:hypothetical protein
MCSVFSWPVFYLISGLFGVQFSGSIIVLQALALNLGAVPIGAFEDDKVKQGLALLSNQQPLYLIPVGHPG